MRLKAKHKKEVTQLKLKNKKNIAKAKVKERSKRLVASVPIVGTVLLLWAGKDEYEDYQEWLKDTPTWYGGSRSGTLLYYITTFSRFKTTYGLLVRSG